MFSMVTYVSPTSGPNFAPPSLHGSLAASPSSRLYSPHRYAWRSWRPPVDPPLGWWAWKRWPPSAEAAAESWSLLTKKVHPKESNTLPTQNLFFVISFWSNTINLQRYIARSAHVQKRFEIKFGPPQTKESHVLHQGAIPRQRWASTTDHPKLRMDSWLIKKNKKKNHNEPQTIVRRC